jgi:hypothetical protein
MFVIIQSFLGVSHCSGLGEDAEHVRINQERLYARGTIHRKIELLDKYHQFVPAPSTQLRVCPKCLYPLGQLPARGTKGAVPALNLNPELLDHTSPLPIAHGGWISNPR